ncbi:MAG: hypothetical protein KC766_10405 [Myxococcales bacterium]|nr:hypothetical protein [Myxococcales bacterium]
MSLLSLLERSIDHIPECHAAAVMDLATGMVLATHSLDDEAKHQLDLLLPASSELFQERSLAKVDGALSSAQPPSHRPSREVLLVASGGIQLFLRGSNRSDIVLLLLADNRVSVSGMLPSARRALGAIEAAL